MKRRGAPVMRHQNAVRKGEREPDLLLLEYFAASFRLRPNHGYSAGLSTSLAIWRLLAAAHRERRLLMFKYAMNFAELVLRSM